MAILPILMVKLAIQMVKTNKYLLCFTSLLLAASLLFTIQLGYGQGSYFIKNFNSEEYNAHRQVWSIDQHPSGSIFFGNVDGLLRYDGVKWDQTHISNNTIIRSLYTGNNGTMYYGSEGDFGRIIADSLNQPGYDSFLSLLPDSVQPETIFNIVEDNGQIYFQSQPALFIYSENRSEIDVLTSEFRFSQLVKSGNSLFIRLIGKGLAKVNGTELTFLPGSELFADERMMTAEQTMLGTLFASWSGGITLFNQNSFTKPDQPYQDFLQNFSVYRSQKINDHEIAFATLGGGIAIVNLIDHSLNIINEENGLINNVVYELFQDSEGILWAATDHGISKILIDTPIKKFNQQNGLSGGVFALAHHSNFIYALTTEGIFQKRDAPNTNFSSFTETGRPYDIHVSGNKTFISTFNGFFSISNNGVIQKLSDTVFRLFDVFSDQGTDYIAGFTGSKLVVARIEDLNVIPVRELDNIQSLNSLLFERDKIWIIEGNQTIKAWYYREESTLKEYALPLAADVQIRLISYINHQLAAGTDEGFFFFNPESDTFSNQSVPEPYTYFNDKQIFRYQPCGDEEWIRANRRIFRIKEKNISATPYQLIGEDEEISSITCQPNGVWFGGNAGVYHLEKRDWNYESKFRTNITGVFVNNDSLIYAGFGESLKNQILDYKDNELRFTYAAASFISPSHNSYQVKLDGFESDWSNWTSETQKDYTNIPEGSYTFRVRSKNVFDVEGLAGEFSFDVLPPWYRTRWAYFLYLLVFSGVLYTFHRIRINQILKIQAIRNKIASDLHDEVSATLSSISFFSEAVLRQKPEIKDNKYMNLISNSANDAKEKITDIIWAIHPENDTWNGLLTKCRRFASDMLESKDLTHQIDISDDVSGKPSLEMRQHVWLIYKEMITNALRHANAKRVDVSFQSSGRKLILTVQDDGCGFDEKEIKKGNGLKNIRDRAEAIQANLEINSKKGKGTRISLTIDI